MPDQVTPRFDILAPRPLPPINVKAIVCDATMIALGVFGVGAVILALTVSLTGY